MLLLQTQLLPCSALQRCLVQSTLSRLWLQQLSSHLLQPVVPIAFHRLLQLCHTLGWRAQTWVAMRIRHCHRHHLEHYHHHRVQARQQLHRTRLNPSTSHRPRCCLHNCLWAPSPLKTLHPITCMMIHHLSRMAGPGAYHRRRCRCMERMATPLHHMH